MAAMELPAREVTDYEALDKKHQKKVPTKKVQPKVTIQVPAEVLAGVQLGGEVTVTIVGDLTALDLRKDADSKESWDNRSEITVAMDTIEVKSSGKDNKAAQPAESPNPFADLVAEDD